MGKVCPGDRAFDTGSSIINAPWRAFYHLFPPILGSFRNESHGHPSRMPHYWPDAILYRDCGLRIFFFGLIVRCDRYYDFRGIGVSFFPLTLLSLSRLFQPCVLRCFIDRCFMMS